jgi:hypothetical protein
MTAAVSFSVAVALAGKALAQDISTSVEVSGSRSFVPLQSYAVGEIDGSLLFFCGLADMGLHSFGESAFPVNKFSTMVHMVDRATGDVTSASISHLTAGKRRALTVTAPAYVQYGDTLYLYGGYGPPVGFADFHTRATVSAINLAAVKQAIEDAVPIQGSAIIVSTSSAAKVAGGGIVKFGDRFALICGADADSEYNNAPDPEYSNVIHIFDRTVSMTAPVETLDDGLGFDSPMHRRDVNVLPVTLPDSGGTRPGFIVVCGVFESAVFPWENPLIWGEGDSLPFMDDTFVQHIGQYEGPIASFYSEARDINHALIYSGISGYNYDSGSGEFNWNPSTPWTTEAAQLQIGSGVFLDEAVVGEMPWPVTNARLIVEDSLPQNDLGQILIDQLPTETQILLGRIYGGIAADMPGDFPPTSGSSAVLDVYITVARDPGQAATLNDYVLNFGTHISGGVVEASKSDDTYLRLRSRFGFTAQQPNVMRCTFGLVSPLDTPAFIDLAVESRMNQTGGQSQLSLRNWSTSAFNQVHQYPLPTTDQTENVFDLSAVDRVRLSDQRVELRVNNFALVTFSASGFDTRFDMVRVEVR